MSNKINSKEYLASLDESLIKALGEIISEEQNTSRLLRKGRADDGFIENLCEIIDKCSAHWKEGRLK